MIKITLGAILDEKNMSQKDLAKELNVTENTVSSFKKNKYKSIPIELLNNICTILECDISDIIKYVPDK